MTTEEEYSALIDIGDQNKVFEFGKLYYEDTSSQIYSVGMPLFENPEMQSKYENYAPYIVGKAGLLKAIEIYKTKIISYYESLFEDGENLITPLVGLEFPKEKSKEEKWEKHIKNMLGNGKWIGQLIWMKAKTLSQHHGSMRFFS